MKKILLLLLFIGAVACASPKPEQLKVLVWNTWHAGHLERFGDTACRATVDILKASQADVVLMIETYGSAPEVAAGLGYNYELLSNNLCIFSRYPITRRITYDSIATFNFGGVEIDFNGRPVVLFDTWLHYLPDPRLTPTNLTADQVVEWENAGTRDEEVASMLAHIAPLIAAADSVPIIMGGDFNSHSHLDWTAATRNMYNHGGAVVDWGVSRAMVDAGFEDSFRKANSDPCTNIGTTWIEATDDNLPVRCDRIDFIYYQGSKLRLVASESYDVLVGSSFLYKGKKFIYPSDHGFVFSTFEFTD